MAALGWLLNLGCAGGTGITAVSGPYYVDAAEGFVAGGVAGEGYVAGRAAGEGFVAGAIAGEGDGRSS